MDFLQNQIIIKLSSKYDDIYEKFNKEMNFPYQQLFLICVTLGASQGKKVISEDRKGREFRSTYFKEEQKPLLYSIILNDENLGKDIERFNDPKFVNQAIKLLIEYANGGMELLIENVFKDKWNGVKLDDHYHDYDVDILRYAYDILNDDSVEAAPF
jgi:hypothetical protein